MHIAVVGAGLFGVTAAVRMAERCGGVELFDEHDNVLCGASWCNEFRLHRGYHYPRSPRTIEQLRGSEESFSTMYRAALVSERQCFYGIAKQGSKTSPDEFIAVCRRFDLPFREARPPWLRSDRLALCVEVEEGRIDPHRLRATCWERLRAAGVKVTLGRHVSRQRLEDYDFVVIATYAQNNMFLNAADRVPYQFEICEKPVVRMPAGLTQARFVVLDGPFMCVDPYGSTGQSLMGNVVHAIHHTSVGQRPQLDPAYTPLMNAGLIRCPPRTRIARMLAHASEFMPGIASATHVGSMFTIRTVLPHVDDTDERPTIVRRIDDRIVTIFSGKLPTCVQAADQAVAMLQASPVMALPRVDAGRPSAVSATAASAAAAT